MRRIAIIGCGHMGRIHGLIVQDLGYECVAAMDIDPVTAARYVAAYPELRADFLMANEWKSEEARAHLRAMFRAPTPVTSIGQLAELGPMDGVIIATYPGSHAELTCAAARMGARAVLCEKPMGLSDMQNRTMIEACREHRTRLGIYDESPTCLPQFRKARELIESGAIGEVEFIRLNTAGSAMDWSTYLWAALRHLITGKEVSRVSSQFDCGCRAIMFGIMQEDQGVVGFTFGDGIPGVLLTGKKITLHHAIRIDGTHGWLEVAFHEHPSLRYWTSGSPQIEVLDPPHPVSYDFRREFTRGIIEDDPVFSHYDGESSRRANAPALAAWQSHFESRPIDPRGDLSVEIATNHAET